VELTCYTALTYDQGKPQEVTFRYRTLPFFPFKANRTGSFPRDFEVNREARVSVVVERDPANGPAQVLGTLRMDFKYTGLKKPGGHRWLEYGYEEFPGQVMIIPEARGGNGSFEVFHIDGWWDSNGDMIDDDGWSRNNSTNPGSSYCTQKRF